MGRDCGLTDCPATTSTTVAQGDGVTVVAPTDGGGAGKTGGGCAEGWQTCGGDVGGGCCPPGGFECGTASCTKGAAAKVTGAGGVSVAKAAAGGNSSEGVRTRCGFGSGGAVVVGLAMAMSMMF